LKYGVSLKVGLFEGYWFKSKRLSGIPVLAFLSGKLKKNKP
jgi:hypothetical protein